LLIIFVLLEFPQATEESPYYRHGLEQELQVGSWHSCKYSLAHIRFDKETKIYSCKWIFNTVIKL